MMAVATVATRRLIVERLPILTTALLTLPLAVIGLGSIVGTSLHQLSGEAEQVDFVAFYTAARLMLSDPSRLYDWQAWASVQSVLHSEPLPILEFWNPPHTALLLAPLAALPFGVAYLVWLVGNLACLAAACALLAPRLPNERWWGLKWTLAVLLFLPVQLGLIMGQMCFALLLGFAVFVRLAPRASWARTGLALVPWTWKPHLLPVLLLALGARRAWRTLLLVSLLPAGACLGVALLAGPSLLGAYLRLATGAGSGVVAAEGTHLDAGHGFLGLAQWLVGPGPMASGLAMLASLGMGWLVVRVWREGLVSDARRWLQLAMLPIAATLGSPHVLGYDATLWLGSAWLALRFAAAVPQARRLIMTAVLIGWWGGNLAALPRVSTWAPWGALSGVACLVVLAWLLHDRREPAAGLAPRPFDRSNYSYV